MNGDKTVSSLSSLTLSNDEITKLINYVKENSLKEISITNQYELLRVKNDNIFFILYKNGKLVYNNETSKSILNEIFSIKINYDYILGSDETGKGEWYGPLVACCMALDQNQIVEMRKLGVKDSKLLSKKSILDISNEMIKIHPVYKSRIIMPETYNRMYEEFKKEGKNLNDLLAWAHTSAIKDVLNILTFNKVRLVIDKFDEEKTYRRLLNVDKNKVEIIQKTKGESETPVAAASIIAKRAFELTVDDLNLKYNTDLRNINPADIKKEHLKYLTKLHFKNVSKL